MGATTATLEEQEALARVYCPEILEQLRKVRNNLRTLKSRRKKEKTGQTPNETIDEWAMRMRAETNDELIREIWKELLSDGRIERPDVNAR